MLLAARSIDVDVYTGGEAREGLVARAMIAQQDLVLPLWNGNVVPSKPPLFHWLVVLGAETSGAGVTPRTLRAPSVLLAALVVALVLVAGTIWGGRDVGLFAALVLATTPQFIDEAGNGRVDMTLTAAVVMAQLAVVPMLTSGGRGALLIAALGAALAMLAKGPVGPGLVALSVLAFAVRERRLAVLRPFLRPLPILVFVLVAGGWYGLATLHRGADFIAKQIVSENGEALLGGERIPYRSPLFYVSRLLLGGLPWTLFLPSAAARAWSGATPRRYCLAWALAGFVFFSLAPLKRGAYLLPLRPALALVVGWWLAEVVQEKAIPRRALRALAGVAVMLGMTLMASALVVVALGLGTIPITMVSPLMPDVDVASVAGLLDGREIELLVLALGGVAGAWVAARAVLQSNVRRGVVALAATTAAAILLVQGVVAPVRGALASVRPFAVEVGARVRPDEPLALLTPSEEIPFLFYVGRDMPIVRGRMHDVGPGYYVLTQERWDGWYERDGWEEVLRSPDLHSRHRADLVLVRRR